MCVYHLFSETVLQCAFPKNRNILLYNRSTAIEIRKFNTDAMLLSSPCSIFKSHNCPNVLCSHFVSVNP